MLPEPLDKSDNTRAVHTVLGLLLLIYSVLGLTSNQFFALASPTAYLQLHDPVAWLMLAAMLCGVAVLAIMCSPPNEEECARDRLRLGFVLLFQSLGWVLFFAAALLYVHDYVLAMPA